MSMGRVGGFGGYGGGGNFNMRVPSAPRMPVAPMPSMSRNLAAPGAANFRPNFGSVPNFGNVSSYRPGITPNPAGQGGFVPRGPAMNVGGGFQNVRPSELGNFLGMSNLRPESMGASWRTPGEHLPGVNGNWQNAIQSRGGDLSNWAQAHPDRAEHWQNWGNRVQDNWNRYDHRDYFRPDWWNRYPYPNGYWHYWGWGNRPWGYWWTYPTWGGLTDWFAPWGWTQPYYYDYGSGGNVVYDNNQVSVAGQPVTTTAEMAQSAAELATVAPPADDAAADAAEWMALGTFAISSNESDTSIQRIIQLAVDRQGIISGNYVNTQTNKSYAVQGQVDRTTQRAAFTLVDRSDIVFETGIYNLTQQQTPVAVHFGPDRTEQYLFVRLQQPDAGDTASNPGAPQADPGAVPDGP
jgi:hypothetical protein